MAEMIAYCGIDCGVCPALIATMKNDNELRKKTAAEWSRSFGHDFKPEEINCTGCLTNGAHVYYCDAMCDIRKCAKRKKVPNCGYCAAYSCEKLDGFLKNVPAARKRLATVRAERK
ncbi:MAG: DUF3795 domain-containing protein [candidate division WOR-3 bacterium]